MSKFLLLILVIVVVWRLAPHFRRREPPAGAPPGAPQQMVHCEHCGLYLPQDEAIGEDGRYYCCAEHRRLAA
jgi:uncharacterized protein